MKALPIGRRPCSLRACSRLLSYCFGHATRKAEHEKSGRKSAKTSIVQGQAERGGDESEREQNKGGMDQIQRGRNERDPAETRVPEQAGYEPEGIAEPSTGTGSACERNLRVFDSVVAQIVRTSKCNNSENANQAYLT